MLRACVAVAVVALGVGPIATKSLALSDARRQKIYDFVQTMPRFSFDENFERFRASCEKERSAKDCAEGEAIDQVKKEIAIRLYQGTYDTMDCLAKMEDAQASRDAFETCISKRQEDFDNFHGPISKAFRLVTFWCLETSRLREEEVKYPPRGSLLKAAPSDTRFVLVKYRDAYDCLRSKVFKF